MRSTTPYPLGMRKAALAAVLLTIPLWLPSCRPCEGPAPAAPTPTCRPPQPQREAPAPAPTRLKIFVTHDVHGFVAKDPGEKRIGYARLKARVDAARRQGWQTILMDAGDAFSGNIHAQFDHGRSIAAIMGKMGYRVMAPGNHAFDFNLAENNPLYYSDTLLPAVRDAAPDRVDVVCGNLTYQNGEVPGITRGAAVVHDGTHPGGDGLRLIVAGALTPNFSRQTYRLNAKGYDAGLRGGLEHPDHEATRETVLASLAEAVRPYDRPRDIVLVLSHIGYNETADFAHGQISGRDLASVPNVDMIADSHTHNLWPAEKIGDVHYGIAGRYLEHFFEISIVADPDGVDTRFEILGYDDVLDREPDPGITALVGAIHDALGMDERLFELGPGEALDDDRLKFGNLPLGRFLCRALRDITGADLALYNSGGIRDNLPPGWITVERIHAMFPFSNNLVTYSLTGKEITDLFAGKLVPGTNAFPQFYGMDIHAWADPLRPEEAPVIVGVLDARGRPLEPEQTYIVAMNSYMACGGDEYSVNPDALISDYGVTSRLVIEHLRQAEDLGIGELFDHNPLRLFETEAEAREAFEKAAETASVEPKAA